MEEVLSVGARLAATVVAGLLFSASGCESVTVAPVPVASIELDPDEIVLLEGESRAIEIRHLGPDGERLSGRETTWSVDDPGVASVGPAGRVEGERVGGTVVRARSEGREAAVDVSVLEGPRIGLDPAVLDLSGPARSEDPLVADVQVTNLGNGNLESLDAAVAAGDDGVVPGWLAVEFEGPSAPTTLTVSIVLSELAPGRYTARILVDDPSAPGAPAELPVSLEVFEPPPVIELSPGSVAFTSSAGSHEPASQEIRVENAGGGELDGLEIEILYTQGRSGWLDAELGSTVAPTTLELEALARELPQGEYRALVRVGAPEAEPPTTDLVVAFTVGAGGGVQ